MTGDPGAPAAAVEAALAELGLPYENPRPGAYLVKLEGQHKLATMTWLVVGAHSLGVEAFFCRQPDENHEAFYRFLLERNGRMYGVHFTLDPVGDVYLTGRLPLSAVSTEDIDRLLIHEFGHQYSGDHLSADYHDTPSVFRSAFGRGCHQLRSAADAQGEDVHRR